MGCYFTSGLVKGRCFNYEASPCEYYMACRFPWESTFLCTTQLYLYSAPATILQVDYSVALQTGIVSIVFYFSAKAFFSSPNGLPRFTNDVCIPFSLPLTIGLTND